MGPDRLTTKQAAEIIGVHPETVRVMIRSGVEIPHIRLSKSARGKFRFSRKAVEEWFEKQQRSRKVYVDPRDLKVREEEANA